jgi:hypothetical protein
MKVPAKLKGFVFESLAETQAAHVRRAHVFNQISKITPLRVVLFDLHCFEGDIYDAEAPQVIYEGQTNFLPLIKVLDGQISLDKVNGETVFWLPSEGVGVQESTGLIGLPTSCSYMTAMTIYVTQSTLILTRHKRVATPKRLSLSGATALIKDSYVSVKVEMLKPDSYEENDVIFEVSSGRG